MLNDLVSANEDLKKKIHDTCMIRDGYLKEVHLLARKNEILLEEVGSLEEALLGRSTVEGQIVQALQTMQGLCDEDLLVIKNIV